MLTLLIVFTFFIYIGLGIPDSAIGAAWPSIFPDLMLPVGTQSLISFLIAAGTITASFFSAKLINKFGTGLVTAISTSLTAVALLGFSLSHSLIALCLCAIPAGLGAGAIDAALNNFAATHFSSFQMNCLHCFYGIGVSASPFIFSLALKFGKTWHTGYFVIFIIQCAIALLTFISLPLWNKVKEKEEKEEEFVPKTLKVKDMIKIPAIRAAWLTFFSTVALEFACDDWIATYLSNNGEMSVEVADSFTSLYFLGIMAGRFTSGLLTKKLKISTITQVGYSLIGVCVVLQFLPIPVLIKGASFSLIGLGNGPTFPNFTFITPKRFGKELSQSIVSSQMVACNLGVMLSPLLFGIIGQAFGVHLFPYFIAFLFVLTVLSTMLYNKRLKRDFGEGI